MRARAVVGLLLAVQTRSAAQADVLRIVGPDGAAIASSTDVLLTVFGTARPDSVRVSTRLNVGDELRSRSGRTIVVLQCRDSSEITLEGEFRAAIMPGSPGKSCFLNLHAGRALVTGDTTTGLGVGDVTMGAKRTRYAVSVTRTGDRVQRGVEVFDGEVEVQERTAARTINVTAGRGLAVAQEDSARPMAARQYRTAALTYARIDASRTDAERRPLATRTLADAYEQVLVNPERPEPRLKLVERQVQFNAAGSNTIYELKRARATTPPASEIEPATAAVSAAAYSQLGRNDLAASHLTTLQRYDAATLDRALLRYEINPETIRRAGRVGGPGGQPLSGTVPGEAVRQRDSLVIRAVVDPSTVRRGATTTITVHVMTQSGTAVPEAAVTLEAGGGTFGGGVGSVSGRANREGVFRTTWSCQTCAAAYSIVVRATKDGVGTGLATARVTIVQ
jgi:hypothetical protein